MNNATKYKVLYHTTIKIHNQVRDHVLVKVRDIVCAQVRDKVSDPVFYNVAKLIRRELREKYNI